MSEDMTTEKWAKMSEQLMRDIFEKSVDRKSCYMCHACMQFHTGFHGTLSGHIDEMSTHIKEEHGIPDYELVK